MEPPFPEAQQLCDGLDRAVGLTQVDMYLPGHPRVLLRDEHGMLEFLEREYCSADLNRIAESLWWMSKQDSANISSLHRQRVKRRLIVVAEDPKLHLVWIRDRIFVKPLPRYLTSNAFWKNHLDPDPRLATFAQTHRIRRAALGFLRTYFYLIRSEHDFHIAQDPSLRLVHETITWEQFCQFASSLVAVADDDVSERYTYGEIRLTRLNFYAPLLLQKATFQRVEYQTGDYFAQFYGPILFVIGITSIVLNGFQIAVGVEQASPSKNGYVLLSTALWFSVTVMLCFCCVGLCLLLFFFYRVAKEWNYAIADRLHRKPR